MAGDFWKGFLVGLGTYWFFTKTIIGKEISKGFRSMTEYYISKAFERYR